MNPISEQEVWLRAYCAALEGSHCYGRSADASSTYAREAAGKAVADFAARYPASQFVFNEGKIE